MLPPLIYSKMAIESGGDELPGRQPRADKTTRAKAKEDDGYDPPLYAAAKGSPIHLVTGVLPTLTRKAYTSASQGNFEDAQGIVAEVQALIDNNTDSMLQVASYGGSDKARLYHAESVKPFLDGSWLHGKTITIPGAPGAPNEGNVEVSLAEMLDPNNPYHATLASVRNAAAAAQLNSEDPQTWYAGLRAHADPFIQHTARQYSGEALAAQLNRLSGDPSGALAVRAHAERKMQNLRLADNLLKEHGGDSKAIFDLLEGFENQFVNSKAIINEAPSVFSAFAGNGPITADNATEVMDNIQSTATAFFNSGAPAVDMGDGTTLKQTTISDISKMPTSDIKSYFDYTRAAAAVAKEWNSGNVVTTEDGQTVPAPVRAEDVSALNKVMYDPRIIAMYKQADGLGLFNTKTQGEADALRTRFLQYQGSVLSPELFPTYGEDPITKSIRVTVDWGGNTLGANDVLLPEDQTPTITDLEKGSASGVASIFYEAAKSDLAKYVAAHPEAADVLSTGGAGAIPAMLSDVNTFNRLSLRLLSALQKDRSRYASGNAPAITKEATDAFLNSLAQECRLSADGSINWGRVAQGMYTIRGTEDQLKRYKTTMDEILNQAGPDSWDGKSREAKLMTMSSELSYMTGIDPNTKMDPSDPGSVTYTEKATHIVDLANEANNFMHVDDREFAYTSARIMDAVSQTLDLVEANVTQQPGESAPDRDSLFRKFFDTVASELGAAFPNRFLNTDTRKITLQALEQVVRPPEGTTVPQYLTQLAKAKDVGTLSKILTQADRYLQYSAKPQANTTAAKYNARILLNSADIGLNLVMANLPLKGDEGNALKAEIYASFEEMCSVFSPDSSPERLSSLKYLTLGANYETGNFIFQALPDLVREASIYAPESVQRFLTTMHQAATLSGKTPLFSDGAYAALMVQSAYSTILSGLDDLSHSINAEYGETYSNAFNTFMQGGAMTSAALVGGKDAALVSAGLQIISSATEAIGTGPAPVEGLPASNNSLFAPTAQLPGMPNIPTYAGDTFSPWASSFGAGFRDAATVAPFAMASTKNGKASAAITASAFVLGTIAERIRIAMHDGTSEDQEQLLGYLSTSCESLANMELRDAKTSAKLRGLYEVIQQENLANPTASFQDKAKRYVRFLAAAVSLTDRLDPTASAANSLQKLIAPASPSTGTPDEKAYRTAYEAAEFTSTSGMAKTVEEAKRNKNVLLSLHRPAVINKMSRWVDSAVTAAIPAGTTAAGNLELRAVITERVNDDLGVLLDSGVDITQNTVLALARKHFIAFGEAQRDAKIQGQITVANAKAENQLTAQRERAENQIELERAKQTGRLEVVDRKHDNAIEMERLKQEGRIEMEDHKQGNRIALADHNQELWRERAATQHKYRRELFEAAQEGRLQLTMLGYDIKKGMANLTHEQQLALKKVAHQYNIELEGRRNLSRRELAELKYHLQREFAAFKENL